jgi:hypothetical protein
VAEKVRGRKARLVKARMALASFKRSQTKDGSGSAWRLATKSAIIFGYETAIIKILNNLGYY